MRPTPLHVGHIVPSHAAPDQPPHRPLQRTLGMRLNLSHAAASFATTLSKRELAQPVLRRARLHAHAQNQLTTKGEQAECREPLGGWPAVLSGFDSILLVFMILDLRFAVPDSGRSS